MAPSTTSSSTKKINQFFTSQRAASTAKASKLKPLKSSPSISSTKPLETEQSVPNLSTKKDDNTFSPSSTINISSSEDEDVILSNEAAQRSVKRLKTTSSAAKSIGDGMKHKPATSDTSEDDEPVATRVPRKTLEALENSAQVKRLYNQARDRMGNSPPIHADDQTKVHHILRVFDMSYEYGPCVGMTRLQRWERANKLGLNPPAEVHEILLTETAAIDNTYRQSVFYDDV